MSTWGDPGSADSAVASEPLASRMMVLMFTDVAGSVQLKETLGIHTYARLISRHDTLFRSIISSTPGAAILQDAGDGFVARFATPSDAVKAALRFQHGLWAGDWEDQPLGVRVGLHVGEMTELDASAYPGAEAKVVGMPADMAARVMSLASPGQILMTRAAFDDARHYVRQHPVGPEQADTPHDPLAPDDDESDAAATLEWVAHGRYTIKGHDEPVEVFEVGVRGRSPLTAPPGGDKGHRVVTFEEEPTLGWRPAVGREVPGREGWRLQRPLGEGGFGEVWLAGHVRTKERRVFKFCFDPAHLRSLKRELTLFRLLRESLGDRPDVAKLHEVQLEHPPFFLESEFSELGSLSDWSATRGGIGRVPLATRLDIVARAADATAAAHSVGVLHKDIKPQNILIYQGEGRSPRPRLADFGIGALTDPGRLSSFAITASGFTQVLTDSGNSGRSGTAMYAPPELVAGRPFTTQGDVYALGVLLYQMAAGDLRKPLAEGWQRDVEDPLLREDIAACVEGDPARRLASAAELARRVRGLEQRRAERRAAEAAAVAAERRRRLYRFSLVGSGVLALLLVVEAVLTTWHFRRLSRQQARTVAEKVRADENALAARGQRERADRQLADFSVRFGVDLLGEDDVSRALLQFVEALEIDQRAGPDPAREAAHRVRVAMTMRALPRLVNHVPPPGVRPTPGPREHYGRGVDAIGDGVKRREFEARVPGVEGPIHVRIRHDASILYCELSPDGSKVLTASSDRTARVWDRSTGRPVTPPLWHEGPVTAARFLPGAPHLVATWTRTETVRVWDLSGLPGAPVPAGAPGNAGATGNAAALPHRGVTHAAFSPDGTKVATADADGGVRVWSTAGRQVAPNMSHGAHVRWITFSPDGATLLTAGDDGAARAWDAASGALRFRLPHGAGDGDDRPVVFAAFSPDGTKVVTAGRNRTARLWDAATGRPTPPAPLAHGEPLAHAAFSPDGSLVATGGGDGARLWRTATGEPALRQTLHHGERVNHVAFSPDGSRVATAGEEVAHVWEAAGGALLTGEGLSHQNRVQSVAFSPDGTRLLTASRDAGLHLWDMTRGDEPHTIGRFVVRMRHLGPVEMGAFSPDGSMVISAGEDGTARLWQPESGTPLSPPLHHPGEKTIGFAAFAPRPRAGGGASAAPAPPLALTVGGGGTARLWDLGPDERPVAGLKAHAETLASQYIDETESYRPFTAEAWERHREGIFRQYPDLFRLRHLPASSPAASSPAASSPAPRPPAPGGASRPDGT